MKDRRLLISVGADACRLALLEAIDNGRPILSGYREITADCADALTQYLDGMAGPAPRRLALDVAGPVNGDVLTVIQSGARFSVSEIQRRFGFDEVLALNDAASAALALPRLAPGETAGIGGADPPWPLKPGRYSLVHVDAGLGVSAMVVRPDGACRAIDTEAGHLAFAPVDEVGEALLRALRQDYGRVSYERLLSLGGLAKIHAYEAGRLGGAVDLTPLEVVLFGRAGTDPACVAALATFCALLGDFAGEVGLAHGATDGVFLSGRLIQETYLHLPGSEFRSRFEAKGRLGDLVCDLPTWAVITPAIGLIGLASAANEPSFAPRSAPAKASPRRRQAAAIMQGQIGEVLDSCANGVVVLGHDLRIEGVNSRYAAGALPARLLTVGKTFGPCLTQMAGAGEISTADLPTLRALFKGRSPFTFARQTVGGRRMREKVRPRAGGGWVITSQDVTVFMRRTEELEQLAAALREAKVQAEEANRIKSTFLAVMSHEIRTPMNGVLGMAQVMAADVLPPRQRARLEILQQSGEVLLGLLNDVLDISKIEAGKLVLESAPFDLAQMLEGVSLSFGGVAEQKGLSLELNIEPSARGQFLGDLTRVRQIVSNLVSNAVKFTSQGAVTVTARATDCGVALAVSDTGIGIAPDRVDHLFEKFVQADSSTTRRFGGTGLGLAICHELTRLMDGEIDVRTEPGVGATFTVRLPLQGVHETAAPTQTALRTTQLAPGLRILVAEDNTINQIVLRTLLEPFDFELRVTDDGAQALDAWRAEPWDLILMDLQMPQLDGLSATRAIRQAETAEGRARTPIIALTADARDSQVRACLDAGMDDHTSKPIQLASLLERMAGVLAQVGAQAHDALAASSPVRDLG